MIAIIGIHGIVNGIMPFTSSSQAIPPSSSRATVNTGNPNLPDMLSITLPV